MQIKYDRYLIEGPHHLTNKSLKKMNYKNSFSYTSNQLLSLTYVHIIDHIFLVL